MPRNRQAPATPTPDSRLRAVARPKQARSEQTLSRILDAAEALIEEKGVSDVSIPEIVRRAGSSVGGFYARFRDKRELLRALEERFFDQLRVRVDALTQPERWHDAPIDALVRACVQELVNTFREKQTLIAAFVLRAAQDPEFVDEGLRFRRQVSEQIRALVLTHRDQLGHPDPELAIELAVQLAFGMMHQVMLLGEIRVGSRRLSDAELVDELTRNFLAYAARK